MHKACKRTNDYIKILLHMITLCNDEYVIQDTNELKGHTFFFNNNDRTYMDIVKTFLENLDRFKNLRTFQKNPESAELCNKIFLSLLHPHNDFYFQSMLHLFMTGEESRDAFKSSECEEYVTSHADQLQEKTMQIIECCDSFNECWLNIDTSKQITLILDNIQASINMEYTIHFAIQGGCYSLLLMCHLISSEKINKDLRDSLLNRCIEICMKMCKESPIFCVQILKSRPFSILHRLIFIEPRSTCILIWTILEVASARIQSDPSIFDMILSLYTDMIQFIKFSDVPVNDLKNLYAGVIMFSHGLSVFLANIGDKHYKISCQLKIQQRLQQSLVKSALQYVFSSLTDSGAYKSRNSDNDGQEGERKDLPLFELVRNKNHINFQIICWEFKPEGCSFEDMSLQLAHFILSLYADCTNGVEAPKVESTLDTIVKHITLRDENSMKTLKSLISNDIGIYFMTNILVLYTNCFLLEPWNDKDDRREDDDVKYQDLWQPTSLKSKTAQALKSLNTSSKTKDINEQYRATGVIIQSMLSLTCETKGERFKESNIIANKEFMYRGVLRALVKYLKGLLYEKDNLDFKIVDINGILNNIFIKRDNLIAMCGVNAQQRDEYLRDEIVKDPTKVNNKAVNVSKTVTSKDPSADEYQHNQNSIACLKNLIYCVDLLYNFHQEYKQEITQFTREQPDELQNGPTKIFDNMSSLGSFSMGFLIRHIQRSHYQSRHPSANNDKDFPLFTEQIPVGRICIQIPELDKQKLQNRVKNKLHMFSLEDRILEYFYLKRISVGKGADNRSSEPLDSANTIKDSKILSMIEEGNDSSSEIIYIALIDWIMTYLHNLNSNQGRLFGRLMSQEPIAVQLMIIFGNIMKIRSKARNSFFRLYFNTDNQDEEEVNNDNKHVGKEFIILLINSALEFQTKIKKSIFTLDMGTTCEVYFLICTLLKDMVEGNLVKLKLIIGEECFPDGKSLKNIFNGLVFEKSPSAVDSRTLLTTDRADLAWYNIITLKTLTELISGPSLENQNKTEIEFKPFFNMIRRTNINIGHIMYELQSSMVTFLLALLEQNNPGKMTALSKEISPEDMYSTICKHMVNLYNHRKQLVKKSFSRIDLKPYISLSGKRRIDPQVLIDYYKSYTEFSTHPSMQISQGLFFIMNMIASSKKTSKYNKFLLVKERIYLEENNKDIVSDSAGYLFSKIGLGNRDRKKSDDDNIDDNDTDDMQPLEFDKPEYKRMQMIAKEFKENTLAERDKGQKEGNNPPGTVDTSFTYHSSSHDSQIVERPDSIKESPHAAIQIYGFLSEVTASLEILLPAIQSEGKEKEHNRVQVFFPKLPETFMITQKDQDKFISECSFKDSNSKVLDLMNFVSEYYIEIKHNQDFFRRYTFVTKLIQEDYFNYYKILLWILGAIVNILALADLKFDGNNDYRFESTSIRLGVKTLVIIIIALSGFALLLWIFSKYTERVKKEKNRLEADSYLGNNNKLLMWFKIYIKKSIFDDLTALSYIFHIVAGALALKFSPCFYSIHLFTIIFISKTTRYVIKSITEHYNQLLITLLLTIMAIYSYSVVVGDFFYDRIANIKNEGSDEEVKLCSSLASCLFFSTDIGLRDGMGMKSILKPLDDTDRLYNFKLFIDVSFFILINLVAMNIVFGIILDTFAELRDEQQQRDFDTENVCFICGFERKLFEKQEKKFSTHLQVEHNIWAYAFYLIYLKSKDEQQFNGIEFYVAEKFHSRNTDWFPIQNTMFISKLCLIIRGRD